MLRRRALSVAYHYLSIWEWSKQKHFEMANMHKFQCRGWQQGARCVGVEMTFIILNEGFKVDMNICSRGWLV
jgi:hypothetical protein